MSLKFLEKTVSLTDKWNESKCAIVTDIPRGQNRVCYNLCGGTQSECAAVLIFRLKMWEIRIVRRGDRELRKI